MVTHIPAKEILEKLEEPKTYLVFYSGIQSYLEFSFNGYQLQGGELTIMIRTRENKKANYTPPRMELRNFINLVKQAKYVCFRSDDNRGYYRPVRHAKDYLGLGLYLVDVNHSCFKEYE